LYAYALANFRFIHLFFILRLARVCVSRYAYHIIYHDLPLYEI
jgi:hypothetical protein